MRTRRSWGSTSTRFDEELAKHVHADRVHEDFMSGVRSGVNGTPTFYINGVRHDDSYERAGPAGRARTRCRMSLPVEGRFPSLAGATGWLNSPPLDPQALRGNVVVVNFCTYTCINWLRTLSYVRAWAEKYQKLGIVMIGVHTPEFSFEHDVDNAREALASMRVEYPVALDNDYAVWDAFANRYWPALYFIDAEGRIRHHQFGEGDEERSERVDPGTPA